jgi:hypothetical protein
MITTLIMLNLKVQSKVLINTANFNRKMIHTFTNIPNNKMVMRNLLKGYNCLRIKMLVLEVKKNIFPK